MSVFEYNSPTVRFLVKVANMLIASLYWVLCCLPLVTILPACAGLYYATTHAVFKTNTGVTKAFFTAFKGACRPGILLSVIADVLAVLIYLGVITGLQTWKENLFWAFYLAAGLLIALLLVQTAIFLGPTLSRFEGGLEVVLRLSIYFASKHLLRSIGYVLLLAVMVYIVTIFPLLLLIVPVLYTDLIHGGVEKTMNEYIESAGLGQSKDGGPNPPGDGQ